jgi:hypothetical protein
VPTGALKVAVPTGALKVAVPTGALKVVVPTGALKVVVADAGSSWPMWAAARRFGADGAPACRSEEPTRRADGWALEVA